jgi:hypothetical protein
MASKENLFFIDDVHLALSIHHPYHLYIVLKEKKNSTMASISMPNIIHISY